MRLQWFVIVITLLVTFSTFGQPFLFDRLLIGLLVVTALVSLKWDKNLFTLCLIFIFIHGFEELIWTVTRENRYLVIPIYFYLGYACYITRYSLMGKLSAVFAVASISAESYWILVDKDGPRIFWYVFICANLLVTKHLVLLRPHFCSIKFPKWDKDWAITKADVDIGYAISLRIALEICNISEYLIRHTINLPVLYVYEHYSVVAHGIIGIQFYIFLMLFTENLKSKLFPA